jgi:hypothetical protein
MPNVRKGESKSKYVARYVSSAEAIKSFPDVKQRLAVAYSEYKRKGK